MKRILTIAVTILFLIPSVSYSSYLIELKNGSEYVTMQYWQSDRDIQFYYHGGIVLIPKDTVITVSESDKPYYEESASVETGSVSNAPAGMAGSDAANDELEANQKEPTQDRGKKAAIQNYKEKKSQLEDRVEYSLSSLRTATLNGDKAGKERARMEMIEYSRQMHELTDELKEQNDGVLPEDWWEGVDRL